ncbi:hypothetical protein [Salinisphaera orenii]|uniref:hypothetical protein n=1 Tax=Salinisphaera orenii TaxID=856731 RepID=UPI000DBE3955
MSATRDICCDLQQTPAPTGVSVGAPAVPPKPPERTPHAVAIDDQMDRINLIVPELVADGCLIDGIEVSADRAEIRLHRRPSDGFVTGPVSTRFCLRGGRMRITKVAGVTLAWPDPLFDPSEPEAAR